jgi:hypothetical protein
MLPRRNLHQKGNAAQSPRPRQYHAPGAVYIRKSSGSGSGWIIALLIVAVAAIAGAVAHIRNRNPILIVEEAPPSSFQLSEIIENPETDGVRPIQDQPAFDESDFFFLPEDEETPPAKTSPVAAEKKAAPLPEPPPPKGITRKEIPHKTPGLEKIPKARIVDILCVYTAQYKNRYGGNKSENIVKRINDMFRESNEKFQSQGTNMAIRIVGVVEVDYYDGNQVADLGELARGKIHSVSATSTHKLREKLGADMVALFGTKGGGGVSSGNPFFVIKRGHGIFTHECQHAFGWGHGEQLPDGKGDDVSKLGRTAPDRAKWMPTKMRDGYIYVEHRGY